MKIRHLMISCALVLFWGVLSQGMLFQKAWAVDPEDEFSENPSGSYGQAHGTPHLAEVPPPGESPFSNVMTGAALEDLMGFLTPEDVVTLSMQSRYFRDQTAQRREEDHIRRERERFTPRINAIDRTHMMGEDLRDLIQEVVALPEGARARPLILRDLLAPPPLQEDRSLQTAQRIQLARRLEVARAMPEMLEERNQTLLEITRDETIDPGNRVIAAGLLPMAFPGRNEILNVLFQNGDSLETRIRAARALPQSWQGRNEFLWDVGQDQTLSPDVRISAVAGLPNGPEKAQTMAELREEIENFPLN